MEEVSVLTVNTTQRESTVTDAKMASIVPSIVLSMTVMSVSPVTATLLSIMGPVSKEVESVSVNQTSNQMIVPSVLQVTMIFLSVESVTVT